MFLVATQNFGSVHVTFTDSSETVYQQQLGHHALVVAYLCHVCYLGYGMVCIAIPILDDCTKLQKLMGYSTEQARLELINHEVMSFLKNRMPDEQIDNLTQMAITGDVHLSLLLLRQIEMPEECKIMLYATSLVRKIVMFNIDRIMDCISFYEDLESFIKDFAGSFFTLDVDEKFTANMEFDNTSYALVDHIEDCNIFVNFYFNELSICITMNMSYDGSAVELHDVHFINDDYRFPYITVTEYCFQTHTKYYRSSALIRLKQELNIVYDRLCSEQG
jgi:hypothetical protein